MQRKVSLLYLLLILLLAWPLPARGWSGKVIGVAAEVLTYATSSTESSIGIKLFIKVSDSILNFSRICALRPLPTAQNFPKTTPITKATTSQTSTITIEFIASPPYFQRENIAMNMPNHYSSWPRVHLSTQWMASSVCHCEESCLAGGDGAVVDSCSCSHDVLHAIRRCVQLSVQEAERVRLGRSMHLLIHIVCSRSHWLQQSLSWDFRAEQLKVRTLSKKIKTSKPHRFLFNFRSFHGNPWLIARSHRLPFFYFESFCRVELNRQ